MRTTHKNIEYLIRFDHFSAESIHAIYGARPADATKCTILAGPDGSRDADKVPIGTATVVRHRNDVPNRVAARKISLLRATESLAASGVRNAICQSYSKTSRWTNKSRKTPSKTNKQLATA